jgi:hypothetical protein
MAGRSGHLYEKDRLNHDKREAQYIVNVVFRAAPPSIRNCAAGKFAFSSGQRVFGRSSPVGWQVRRRSVV